MPAVLCPSLLAEAPVTTYNELYNLHINLTLSNEGVLLHVSEQYSFHTVPLGSKSTRTRSRSSPFRKLTRVYDVQIPNMLEIKSSEAVIVPRLCLCLSLLLLSLIFATFQAIWKLCSATLGGGRSGAMFDNMETMSGHVRTTVTVT